MKKKKKMKFLRCKNYKEEVSVDQLAQGHLVRQW